MIIMFDIDSINISVVFLFLELQRDSFHLQKNTPYLCLLLFLFNPFTVPAPGTKCQPLVCVFRLKG